MSSTAELLALLPNEICMKIATRGVNAEAILLYAAELDGHTHNASLGTCYPVTDRAERKRASATLQRTQLPVIIETADTMTNAALKVLLRVCGVEREKWWAA